MSALSSRGPAWEATKPLAWARDGWTCASCGSWLERKHPDPNHTATVDHVIPKARGGGDDLDNLVSMCLSCNGLKGDDLYLRREWASLDYFPSGLPL